MKKTISVIVTILVLVGAGAKFYTSYMRMQKDSPSMSADEFLSRGERQKVQNELSALIGLMTEDKHQLVVDKSTALMQKYKDHTDPKLHLASLLALKARAESYTKLAEFKKAEDDLKTFINDAKNINDLKKSLASAYVQLIFLQVENDFVQPEEGVALIDQYLEKYGSNSDVAIQNSIILGMKGSLEQKLNLFDDALVSYQKSEEVLAKVVSVQPELAELKTLLVFIRSEKISVLAEKGQTEEAVDLLATIRTEVEKGTSDKTNELLAGLAITEGYISLISAKLNWNNEETRSTFLVEGTKALEEARTLNAKLKDMKEQNTNLALILGNEAYIVYLQDDNRDLAQEKLVEGFTLEGKKLYKGVLRDISLYPMEEENIGFSEIVEAAWAKVQESK